MSTTVPNPYSFNIKNNTSFASSAIAPNLPNKETLLEIIYEETKTITIPSGCKVVHLWCTAPADGSGNNPEIFVKNVHNNKYWCDAVGDGYGVSYDVYVGVTPRKTYKLSVYSINGIDTSCEIYYSASINNHAIDVADY